LFTARRVMAAAAAATVVGASLAGCSLVEVAPPEPLSGLAACVLGNTWNLDTAKLAQDMQTELGGRGITATVAADGTQTLDWNLESDVVLTADYTLTITSGAEGDQTVVTDKHSGKSTGIAYINGEVGIPRDWSAKDLKVTTTATKAGAELEALPYTLPRTDIDDSVGVQLTCDGSALTTQQRGSDLVLTWSKK